MQQDQDLVQFQEIHHQEKQSKNRHMMIFKKQESVTKQVLNEQSIKHMRKKCRVLPDQGIDFLYLDVIHFLHCIFYLLLVSMNVNNENKGIVVLNLLHCRLGRKRTF